MHLLFTPQIYTFRYFVQNIARVQNCPANHNLKLSIMIMVIVQKWLESVSVLKFERGTDPPPPLIEQLEIVGISFELNLPRERERVLLAIPIQ